MARSREPVETSGDEFPDSIADNSTDEPDLADIPAEFAEDEPPETPAAGRKRGRPRGMLPTPARFKLEPPEFFKYWWSLRTDPRISRVVVYPYRRWPVTDVLLELPLEDQERIRRLWAQKKRAPGAPFKHLGLDTTMTPFDPLNWEMEIYHRYGAGDYYFTLNDTDRKQYDPEHKGKPICVCAVNGLRDWDTFPPNCRPGIVVLSDPHNERYLHWARSRGVQFPGDPAYVSETKENEMAEAKAVEALADMAKQAQDRALTPPPAAADNGIAPILQMMMQQQQEFMRQQSEQHRQQMDAMMRRLEAVEKAPFAPVKTVEPAGLDHLEKVVNIVKGLAPEKKGDSDIVALLMQQQKQDAENRRQERQLEAERHKQELEANDKRHAEILALVKENAAKKEEHSGTSGGVSDLVKAIKGIAGLKESLEDLSGGNAAAEGPAWLAPAERIAELVINGATGITGNLAAMKAGAAPAATTPQSNTPGIPAPQQSQQNPPQATMLTPQQFMLKQLAETIHPDLITALRNNQPGYTFAAHLIAKYGGAQGQQAYQLLQSVGVPGILGERGALRLNPELWGDILKFGPKIDQFVNELLQAEKVVEELGKIPQAAPPQQQPQQNGPSSTTAAPTRPNGAAPPDPAGRKVMRSDGKIVQTRPPTEAY